MVGHVLLLISYATNNVKLKGALTSFGVMCKSDSSFSSASYTLFTCKIGNAWKLTEPELQAIF